MTVFLHHLRDTRTALPLPTRATLRVYLDFFGFSKQHRLRHRMWHLCRLPWLTRPYFLTYNRCAWTLLTGISLPILYFALLIHIFSLHSGHSSGLEFRNLFFTQNWTVFFIYCLCWISLVYDEWSLNRSHSVVIIIILFRRTKTAALRNYFCLCDFLHQNQSFECGSNVLFFTLFESY